MRKLLPLWFRRVWWVGGVTAHQYGVRQDRVTFGCYGWWHPWWPTLVVQSMDVPIGPYRT
jgi:hypothetical protein